MSDPTPFQFIPTLWAGAILKALQKKTVFESLCNKDYVGEVRKGDTLKIATVNNPSVNDYEGSITYEVITGSELSLVIDKKKYFAFKADDVDKIQSNIDLLEAATQGAGFALADDVDIFLAGLIADNGTDKTLEAASYLEVLAQVAKIFDDEKAPDSGRWLVMPTEFAKDLTLELVGKLTNNTAILTSGYVGSVMGINLFKSANVEKPIYGHTGAITFANQISETESIRLENSFATGIRGLHVYGAKVTRAKHCGEITATVE